MAELLLTGTGPLKAVAATFRYRRGILVEVVARKVDLSRGQLAAVVGS
jgi:hypothetical protein